MNRYVRPKSRCKRLEQVDDLGSNRDVERRDGLVEHDHLWIERERPGESDPLSLSTGELVREAIRVLRAQADGSEQLVDARLPLLAAVEPVDSERLRHDLTHGHARVERRVRVLEHDLKLAAHVAHTTAAERRDVRAVEDDPTRRRLEQLDHRPPERGLPAARLADEAERLAGGE